MPAVRCNVQLGSSPQTVSPPIRGLIQRQISSPSARDAMLGFTIAQLIEELLTFLPQKSRSKCPLASTSYA